MMKRQVSGFRSVSTRTEDQEPGKSFSCRHSCEGRNPVSLFFISLINESIGLYKDSGFRIKCGMTNFVLLVICSFTLIFFPVTASDAVTLDEMVDRIQKIFSEITDLQGSFAQTSYIKDLEETQKYSGTFFLKKPSSVMWEYAKPRDEKVVIRDTDTWIYKKAENQVIKTKFTKEAYSQVPIALLSGMERIRDDFTLSVPEENALQLVPKQRIGFIKTIVMEVVPGDFPVKTFTVIDTYGNIIMIELSGVKINPGLDDSLFIFTPPPGAEVYDMSK
jgi:outer membrane lipoprotein carrier protein